MSTKSAHFLTQNRNIVRIVLGTAAILLVPLIAMQFTNEVDWNLFDFVLIGCLLLGTGLAYEFISRRIKEQKYKILIGIILLMGMLLIWADVAVGIFNIPGFSGS